MKRFTTFACLAMILVLALSSSATEIQKHKSLLVVPEATDFSKAARDTHYLLGGFDHNADYIGNFQTEGGAEDWHQFTHKDDTQLTESQWHADSFAPITGTYSAWAGQDFGHGVYGYDNSWNELIEYVAAVSDPAVATEVNIAFNLRHWLEPDFDFFYVDYEFAGEGTAHGLTFTGNDTLAVTYSVTYQPGNYIDGNKVRMILRMQSDGGYCTVDGQYPGTGGAWVDDIVVSFDGTVVATDNFEGNSLGNWVTALPIPVGDFSKIWSNLDDYDDCVSNYTPQVAFVDDGQVVPGTGGQAGLEYAYGPGGYIVNTTGGLLTEDSHMSNSLLSPIMAWPDASYDGALLWVNVYVHETLWDTSPGIFYAWSVRSTNSANPDLIYDAPWRDNNTVYYGGPAYGSIYQNINDKLVPGRTFVQVRTQCMEVGWWWGYNGNNGSPAPYFDNFRLLAYPYEGPGSDYAQWDLAQDGFPLVPVAYENLENLDVRFDIAKSIAPSSGVQNLPGDSLIITFSPIRGGAVIATMPTIHYAMKRNPVFDAYRNVAYGATGVFDGVLADSITNKYSFDLPDEDFLFPGDVLHYFLYAEDSIGGAEVQGTFVPSDTTGFNKFDTPWAYSTTFTFHALPTVTLDGENIVTPDVLFWNDFGARGGEDEWYLAFANLGLVEGEDYDTYFTNAPSSGVDNGVGRYSAETLDAYSTLLYTCGTLSAMTMSNGDDDKAKDAEVLGNWFQLGNKNMYAVGDGLVTDLMNSGGFCVTMAETWMGVNLDGPDIYPGIGNQATPLAQRILVDGENPVFTTANNWIVYGGCPVINTFDAIRPKDGAERLAEFLNSAGVSEFPYSAATLNINDTYNSRVITMPHSFKDIHTNPNAAKAVGSLPGRVQVLKDILDYFGVPIHLGTATPAPDADVVVFSTKNYPNPFNPTTKIEFTMPKAGHLSLKIYNVRGELVRTLVDEVVEAGNDFRMWDGTNSKGANMSSGVYFYEARTDSDVKVHKMALVK